MKLPRLIEFMRDYSKWPYADFFEQSLKESFGDPSKLWNRHIGQLVIKSLEGLMISDSLNASASS